MIKKIHKKRIKIGILVLLLGSALSYATSNTQHPPVNVGDITTAPKEEKSLKVVEKPSATPKLDIPLPPPIQPQSLAVDTNQTPAPVILKKELENNNDKEKVEEKLDEAKEKEILVNKLMDLNYRVKSPPKQLYQRSDTELNNHLPPVYFKSYYLSLAFKAVKNENLSDLRAVLDNYNFLNGQNKDGDTLLIYAVENNSINVARVLLSRGAFVNGVNNRGRTALHYAATLGNIDMIKLLLTMGADPKIFDDKGLTAKDYATLNNHQNAVDLINRFN